METRRPAGPCEARGGVGGEAGPATPAARPAEEDTTERLPYQHRVINTRQDAHINSRTHTQTYTHTGKETDTKTPAHLH